MRSKAAFPSGGQFDSVLGEVPTPDTRLGLRQYFLATLYQRVISFLLVFPDYPPNTILLKMISKWLFPGMVLLDDWKISGF